MDGFVCIDKPPGPTSFAIVKQLRQLLRQRRAGHAGTLDPAATGVLVVALGRATRLLPFLPSEPKEYRFCLRFGSETDTLDATGAVVHEGGIIPTAEAIEMVLGSFIGDQRQEPPRYSSIKVHGERAYALARKKCDFTLPERSIRIQTLTLERFDANSGEALLTVVCSGGTYVRALARDIARALGTWGHASWVRRTRVGWFTIDKAVPLDELRPDLPNLVMPVREVMQQHRWVTLSRAQFEAVRHGLTVALSIEQPNEFVFAADQNGKFVAVLRHRQGCSFRPVRVFV